MGASKVDSILPTKIPHQTQQYRQLASKLVPAVLSRDLYRLTQQLQKIERIADKPKEQASLWEKWSTGVAK